MHQASTCAARRADVIVIGAGLVGASTAWWLQQQGHAVVLIDPALAGPKGSEVGKPDPAVRSGSRAALGLLMADVAQRSSGRGWRLRQRSRILWDLWCRQLAEAGWPVPRRPGLLVLAADAETQERQQRLVLERQKRGVPLEWWERPQLERLDPLVPAAALGGLYSPRDGQIDPIAALEALLGDGLRQGVQGLAERVLRLERPVNGGWSAVLAGGDHHRADWVVIAAGLGSAGLLRQVPELAGAAAIPPLEPVLGQALELERGPDANDEALWSWPGAVVWRGLNLVPRPDLAGGRRLWLGATLEPGERADPLALERLRSLKGEAPPWLQQARLLHSWQGCRCRPQGKPAPLLEALADGLLLVSGHYRNGVLLAPATAEWVAQQLEPAALPAAGA
ncbi:FAD-dependent oxidoreductase [Synechococcus sp. CBW1107]|uniref:NAD(P)/FAD-dependent oxidoreductase n=1 Tax=Synechococcus sp. CBW1107 TaxID=2789857 RepID=UPI002AD54044|nr:FAD-dependent oxidoreductase [Synechococcus sp. CBW1107]CAK6686704.1 Glycine oxidase [Synechococcus sp. CBW1107]